MEKMSNRWVQPSAKATPEAKKGQDGHAKQWPRGSRRREPIGGTYTKLDVSRKPIKATDKRPRPRGFYYSGAVPSVGGNEGAGLVMPDDAELGSVFVQGSKKQSLNHLLNFHFNAREPVGRSVGKGAVQKGIATMKHKYNKEQFLQANCQFIVKSSGDYRVYMNNPDELVQWDLIEQVNMHVVEFPACPICLYPPMAAKMTRCGHIYCWSCILHYLALSEKAWHKCPICYEAIYKDNLKSVIAVPHPAINIGQNIIFKLMKRLRGSLIVCPADEEIEEGELLRAATGRTSSVYSKLLLADEAEVMSIIERERTQLHLQLQDEENSEKCFVDEAMSLLEKRVEGIHVNKGDLQFSYTLDENEPEQSIKHEDATNTKESKYFYFYQACDGQHVYLHALNVRMLEHTYGSLEFSPRQLGARVIEKESGSMTEELRKRLRYLQHLPVTCPFETAEIDLRPPVVTADTMDFFSDQIETRRKKRQRRARDEKRREKRIVEEENKKMGRFAAANIRIESHRQFPDFETTQIESSPLPVDSIVGSLGSESEGSGLSFAKMLSSKKPSVATWPSLKSDIPLCSPRLITATGTNTKVDFSRIRTQSDSDGDSEGYVHAPSFNESFGDAIAMALEKAALTNNDEQGEPKTVGQKKQKKKKKPTLLFATSMTFSNN